MNDPRNLRRWATALKILAVLILPFAIAAYLYGALFAGPVAPLGGGPHHEAEKPCPYRSIPSDLRADNPDIECVVGSPQNFRHDVSKLRTWSRDDSLLQIDNRSANGVGAMAKGYGCGRRWTVTEKDRDLFDFESRDTGCNLSGHITCHRKRPSSDKWACANKWNKHPN